MTKSKIPVAVTSRSFSKHPVLRRELLERYEFVTFNDEGKQLSGDGLVGFLKGHGKAVTALETIDDALLARLPELKVLSKFGVGVDMIDFSALDRRGVAFGWKGGTNKRSVSELALTLMLALSRNLVAVNAALRAGEWKQQKGFCLSGRVVGLIGCGHIGRDLVGLLRPFDCKILCHDKSDLSDFLRDHPEAAPASLENLLSQSDFVSVHLPLNEGTRHIVSAKQLALMKPSAFLINTARGGLVNETDLKDALKSGRLAGAAFDVFAEEPLRDLELASLPNFLATPHVGGSTEDAIVAMGRAAIEGLDNAQAARHFMKN